MNKQQEETNTNSNSRTLTIRHNELDAGLNALNLFDEAQLAQAEVFLKKIIASDKGGIKSVNEGLAVLMRAKDLNIPFSTSIEHIHVVNGKTGIDIHIAKSLLSRAGVVWECTKDYTPQYQYTDGNNVYDETKLPDYCIKCRSVSEAEKVTNEDNIGVYPLRWYSDLAGNLYNEFQINDKCVKALNLIQAKKLKAEGKFPVIRVSPQPIDYIMEYKFTRRFIIEGEKVIQTSIGHFSYSEAQTAGMFDKDTYKKYPRIMIGHRAFFLGARDIASDVLMGAYETKELKLVAGEPCIDADFVEIMD